MSIFRTKGFDSIISKGTDIRGDVLINPNSTLQIDGAVYSNKVTNRVAVGIPDTAPEVDTKTTLLVTGQLFKLDEGQKLDIKVHNVILAGHSSLIICDEIWVEGTLAIKAGAKLQAKKIYYRDLVIQTGAVVLGQMCHLDHVSEGEIT